MADRESKSPRPRTGIADLKTESPRSSTSSVSDTSAQPSLLKVYERTVSTFEEILQLLKPNIIHSKNLPPTDVQQTRRAKVFVENILSMFVTWACDIRIECGYLDTHKDTIIECLVGTKFDDLETQLLSLLREGKAGEKAVYV